MILSNLEICAAIREKRFLIEPLAGNDPAQSPFNTSAVDLRLSSEIFVPKGGPAAIDLRKGGIAPFLASNSRPINSTEEQPYVLKPRTFVLARTQERVAFPLNSNGVCYSARVEGKSSLARCGILVHFTAPTIHAGFEGTITLEMINFGPMDFLLYPGMFVCQLIIEEVKGTPADAPNQFKGQSKPAGVV